MTIQWRLAVMMAERNLSNKDLIKLTGFHAVTISKLKTTRTMPSRLEYSTLNKLCNALRCQPGDLLSYVPDVDLQVRHEQDVGRVDKFKSESAKLLEQSDFGTTL